MNELRRWITLCEGDSHSSNFSVLADTSDFKAWFNGSKVMDHHGAPLVVWHGLKSSITHIDTINKRVLFSPKFSSFDTGKRIEPGAWFSPQISVAQHYGTPAPFFLRSINPIRMEEPISIRPQGYDAVFRTRSSRADIWDAWEIAVFDPNQIRLAFDVTDPNLRRLP